MNGKPILYIDQYGGKCWARTVKELCDKHGRTRAARMYCDKKDGRTVHVGYIVAGHWCTAYAPVECAA